MSDYLCEDLIDEIMGRLPTKSLIRFRSLSKSWYSRISSLGFIRTHSLRAAKTPQKVFVRQRIHYNKNSAEKSIMSHLGDRYPGIKSVGLSANSFSLAGSCNGIICLIKKRRSVLWNPSIGRKLTVPSPPIRVYIGFGFDPITDDYKIVGIPYPRYEGLAQKSYVYSMKTNSWSEITSTPILCSSIEPNSRSCFVNGALHWVVKGVSDNTLHYYIMTFNLSTNVFGMISLPEPSWVTRHLTIINGYLVVISNEGDNIWIWFRREDNNITSWSTAFNIKTLGSKGADRDFFLKSYANDFEAYNPQTGIRSTLVSLADSSFTVQLDMCVESLELLHGDVLDESYFLTDV